MAKETSTAQIGFEKQIWDAACVLRGNMDASEYKTVVLGLIFLKYISDRFEEKYQALVDEGDGFEEDVDEYTSEGIFFVPANARWKVIADAAHTPEIGTVIPGLGGARKVRIPLEGRGKSGGGRVVYVDIVVKEQIYLLAAYAKNVQTDLDPDQKKVIRKMVEIIKEE